MITEFRTESVARIPMSLQEGVIYISRLHETAIHLCPCGCKRESVTPFYPGGWELTVESDNTISLEPSIVNLGCRSHYYVTHGKVVWC